MVRQRGGLRRLRGARPGLVSRARFRLELRVPDREAAVNRRRWFRVVVDGSGKAVDCKPVGDEGTDSLGIFFILAKDAKEAARLAGNAHSAKLLAARRAQYRAEGRCKCGGKRDDDAFELCTRCRELAREHHERRALRDKGIEPPPRDRREVLQEKKRAEVDSVRLQTLIEVQRAHGRMSDVDFSRWLAKQLEKLTGKVAA